MALSEQEKQRLRDRLKQIRAESSGVDSERQKKLEILQQMIDKSKNKNVEATPGFENATRKQITPDKFVKTETRKPLLTRAKEGFIDFKDRSVERLKEAASGAEEIFQRRGEAIQEKGFLGKARETVGGTAEVLGRGASLAGQVTGEALVSAFRALPGDRKSGIEGGIRKAGRDIIESPKTQKFLAQPGTQDVIQQGAGLIEKAKEFETEHPIAGAAARVGTFVEGAFDAKRLVGGGLKRLKSAGKAGVETTTDVLKKGKGFLGKAVTREVDEIKKIIPDIKSKVKTVEEIAGEIAQGKPKDRAGFAKSVSEVDVADIRTYEDLTTKFDDRIGEIAREVDKILELDTRKFVTEGLLRSEKVGAKNVKTSYVSKALDQLEELYLKTEAPADLERIRQLRGKLDSEGISLKEVNNLAREHGRKKKGFNLSGTPSTSVTKQGYENVRSGVKETFRDLLPDDTTRILDKKMSDLFLSRDLASDMAIKVNRLKQRVSEKGLIEKLSKKAADVFNLMTLGGPRQLLFSLIGLRNQGFKTLNALDLQERLPKLLKQLEQINNAQSDLEMIKLLNKLPDTVGPRGFLQKKSSDFFKPEVEAQAVKQSELFSVKETSPESIVEATKRMKQAAKGEIGKRGAIKVVDTSKGKLIIDGNATFKALKKNYPNLEIPTKKVLLDHLKFKPTDEQIIDAVKLFQQGSEVVKPFIKMVEDIAGEVGGTVPFKGIKNKVKPVASILDKKYGRKDKYLNDLVRDTILIKDIKDVDNIVELLKKRGAVMADQPGIRPGFKNNYSRKGGYRDANIQFKLDGQTYELQVMQKNMFEAKNSLGHRLYDLTDKAKGQLKKAGKLSPQAELLFEKIDNISTHLYDNAFALDNNLKFKGLSERERDLLLKELAKSFEDIGASDIATVLNGLTI